MNKFIVLICFLAVLFSGCGYLDTEKAYDSPTNQEQPSPANEDVSDELTQTSPTPQAKISSDFENAPDAQAISQETGIAISNVLLQDMLTYDISLGDYFAVCLEEDAEKAYRWLLVSDNNLFEFIEETHINGYRVFIFKPAVAGETSILFELTQDSTLVETLSYKIIFS